MRLEEIYSYCSQSYVIPESKIIFEFRGEYYIEVTIVWKDIAKFDVDDCHVLIQDSKEFEKIQSNILNVSRFLISDYEYLGHRKDIGTYSEPTSLAFKMFQFLRTINGIDEDLIKSYRLATDFPDPMCSTEPNYLFEIEIELEKHIKSILKVLSALNQYNSGFIPNNFYWGFYHRDKPLDNLNSLDILTTNTKARRLGYLKLLSEFIFKEVRIPVSRINKKFEKVASNKEIKKQLLSYKNNKGEIKATKSGVSAKPYIDLSENLGLFSKMSTVFSSSKKLKVYQVISGEFAKNNSNLFELAFFDKLFFLESILNTDFLFITVLLELIYIRKITTFSDLKDIFQKNIIDRINHHLANPILTGSAKRKIISIRNRISKWDKPEVYLEHVLMPRINWLLDLELLEMDAKSKEIFLNEEGEIFFMHICCWYDIETDFILSPVEFTQRFIQHTFASFNNIKPSTKQKDDLASLYRKIDIFLDKSFDKFKTLAPNRTTLSQAITYVKYSIFLEDKIPVEHKFIENYIKEKAKEKFIYKYQYQYGDGYLQKK